MTTSEWKTIPATCPQPECRGQLEVSVWESSDGGHVDNHYRCTACRHDWWVDGPDA